MRFYAHLMTQPVKICTQSDGKSVREPQRHADHGSDDAADRAKVILVHEKRGEAHGVEMDKTGDIIKAPLIISGVVAHMLFWELLAPFVYLTLLSTHPCTSLHILAHIHMECLVHDDRSVLCILPEG